MVDVSLAAVCPDYHRPCGKGAGVVSYVWLWIKRGEVGVFLKRNISSALPVAEKNEISPSQVPSPLLSDANCTLGQY